MQIVINISEESYKNIKEQVDKRDYPDMQIGRTIADGVLIPECHGGRLLIVSEKYVKEHMIGLDAFQQKFIGEVDLSIAIVGVIDSIDGDYKNRVIGVDLNHAEE